MTLNIAIKNIILKKYSLIVLLLSPVCLFGQINKQCNQDSLKETHYTGSCQEGHRIYFYKKGICWKQEEYRSNERVIKNKEIEYKRNRVNKTIVKTYYITGDIRSKQITKRNKNRKWKSHRRMTVWDESGEKTSKTRYKAQRVIDDWGTVSKSVTWHFICDGKRCLKRKKSGSSIRLL